MLNFLVFSLGWFLMWSLVQGAVVSETLFRARKYEELHLWFPKEYSKEFDLSLWLPVIFGAIAAAPLMAASVRAVVVEIGFKRGFDVWMFVAVIAFLLLCVVALLQYIILQRLFGIGPQSHLLNIKEFGGVSTKI